MKKGTASVSRPAPIAASHVGLAIQPAPPPSRIGRKRCAQRVMRDPADDLLAGNRRRGEDRLVQEPPVRHVSDPAADDVEAVVRHLECLFEEHCPKIRQCRGDQADENACDDHAVHMAFFPLLEWMAIINLARFLHPYSFPRAANTAMKKVMIVTGASRGIGARRHARGRAGLRRVRELQVARRPRAGGGRRDPRAGRDRRGRARMCRPKPASWPCSTPRTASWGRSPRW